MSSIARLQLRIHGLVQGLGFRPFVFKLARELGLTGWVANDGMGLVVEVEGAPAQLEQFVERLQAEAPAHARLEALDRSWLPPIGDERFEIRQSNPAAGPRAWVLPDLATCPDCLREIRDPSNRRYAYPFTNCTQCGPRFTIVESVPYDRCRTSMKSFIMCEACQREYDDPRDRRFHAQPNACPVCGPNLAWRDDQGRALKCADGALEAAAAALREGQVVAVKGLGGFHLMAAADRDDAVAQLRTRKHREEKPFALMFPGLEQVRAVCEVSGLEEGLLLSAAAPIVLLRRKPAEDTRAAPLVSSLVAPGNPSLGVMLPSTPLHHLLLARVNAPLVATSGNLAEEPICTGENDAVLRLQGIADAFLTHNRPIVRHADDSIVRVIAGREMILRRARGYAPLPIPIRTQSATATQPRSPVVLAVGAHLKNAIALAPAADAFLSQHIGDLETPQALSAFQRVIEDFKAFHGVAPELVACDLHPDYVSTRYAAQAGAPVLPVQHHYAHVLSCMAEHGLEPPVLGVSWDGTGAGTDGTIWGGEFLSITPTGYERVAHCRTFRLPGGEAAVHEPRRSALGLLYEAFGDAGLERSCASVRAFTARELELLRTMLRRGVNAPLTSSVGRLFDAIASMLGLRQRAAFEGQAAMDLEFAADRLETEERYDIRVESAAGAARFDWQPMLEALLEDLGKGLRADLISAKFHNSLAEAIVQLAQRAALTKVVLSGGCFQNRRLTERTIQRLRDAGFCPCWHRHVPPNDGGIALGQVAAARRRSAA